MFARPRACGRRHHVAIYVFSASVAVVSTGAPRFLVRSRAGASRTCVCPSKGTIFSPVSIRGCVLRPRGAGATALACVFWYRLVSVGSKRLHACIDWYNVTKCLQICHARGVAWHAWRCFAFGCSFIHARCRRMQLPWVSAASSGCACGPVRESAVAN